jgi:hypothetical protein
VGQIQTVTTCHGFTAFRVHAAASAVWGSSIACRGSVVLLATGLDFGGQAGGQACTNASNLSRMETMFRSPAEEREFDFE